MKNGLQVGLAVVMMLGILGCSLVPTPAGSTVTPYVPGSTSAASTLVPTSVPASTSPPAPVCAADLAATVVAGLPEGAYDEVGVLPLVVPPGWQSMWAVHSVGMRHMITPLPSHFVSIYDCDAGTWRELAAINLDDINPPDMDAAMPDFIGVGSVTQVQIDPARVWLTVDGGVGVHGGTFQLLGFDGAALTGYVSGISASPGAGSMQDVNEDGVLDVVLDQSDAYVFCYACSVRKIHFRVFYWDSVNVRIQEGRISHFLMGQPQPMRDLVNPAVDMANAGLWKDALVKITEARALYPSYPEADGHSLNWSYGLIKLHADAMAADATAGIYPLLSRVYYGDYAAAVDLMRAYAPAQVFDPAGPLIAGTVAEGYEGVVSDQVIQSADAALGVDADLAEAYLMRGWARYLVDPANPQVRADVHQAAALRPGDAFLADCAALFP